MGEGAVVPEELEGQGLGCRLKPVKQTDAKVDSCSSDAHFRANLKRVETGA